MKRIKICLLVLLLILLSAQEAFAASITSYTYYRSGSGEDDYYPVPAPSPYNYVGSITGKDLGVDRLSDLSSLFVTDQYIYISSGGRILITDHDFHPVHVIEEFEDSDSRQPLTQIDGLWVTEEEEIYACEPKRGRILHFNSDWTIKRVLGKPEGMILSGNVAYEPLKVAVDSVGRIYAVANNIYEGLIEMNVDGSFSRYFGVVNVKFTAADLFWRSIQTDIQRAKSVTWLPVNFSNLTVDQDDFVYATVAGSGEEEPIRKLNAKGNNILRYPISTNIHPHGDLTVNRVGLTIPTGESTIIAVDVNDYGVYAILDSKRSRIFAYDEDGYMLYAFGESGTAEGRFQTPLDLKFMDDKKLLVVDRGNLSIEVFELNEYGKSIHAASRYQYESDYRLAAEEWKKVADYNPAFQYAYVGIGKALYRSGDYKAAQEYFRLGQDIDYYSEAFQKTRKEYLNDKFPGILLVVAICVAGSYVRKAWKRQKSDKAVGV